MDESRGSDTGRNDMMVSCLNSPAWRTCVGVSGRSFSRGGWLGPMVQQREFNLFFSSSKRSVLRCVCFSRCSSENFPYGASC